MVQTLEPLREVPEKDFTVPHRRATLVERAWAQLGRWRGNVFHRWGCSLVGKTIDLHSVVTSSILVTSTAAVVPDSFDLVFFLPE